MHFCFSRHFFRRFDCDKLAAAYFFSVFSNCSVIESNYLDCCNFLSFQLFYNIEKIMPLKNEKIAAIFQENYPNLCRFLESIVGRDNRAQDIAQESFLRLCQAEFGDISTTEIRFWLFRVARNLALNEIQKVNTRSRLWNRVTEFFDKTEPTPEELLLRNESGKIVREMLNRLPEHQRSALLLREREEMNYREIALILNVSESKIKIDIFRARQTLRALWFERQKK